MDHVIQFLTHQIALCGEAGALPAEVFGFLEEYPDRDQVAAFSNDQIFPGVEVSNSRTADPSPILCAKLWKWLGQQPGISVGKEGEANRLSLDEVKSRNDNLTAKCLAQHENPKSADTGSKIERVHCTGIPNSPMLRIYASEDRIWHAVAGHGIDHTRIPRQDFECLAIIARHREAGVLQPDLVKLSGQDLRSVPTRTQRLCDGGYVAKYRTLSANTWTSLLRLAVFDSTPPKAAITDFHDGSQSWTDQATGTTPLIRGIYTKVEAEIRQALRILQESRILVWDDLKRKLNIFTDRDKSKALAKAMRHLEYLGHVQRVHAMGEAGDADDRYHHCIKLVHTPTEEELDSFWRQSLKSQQSRSKDVGRGLEKLSASQAGERPALAQWLGNSREDDALPTGDIVATTSHWTPDRQFSHILLDVVERSGNQGITLSDLSESTVGIMCERPIETHLTHLVDFPTESQPAHLQHLGIFRDTIAVRRTNMYIHYARHRLESLVSSGKVAEEAVGGMLSSYARPPETDSFGFPKLDTAGFMVQSRVRTSRGEGIAFNPKAAYSSHAAVPLPSDKPRGRPRKYPKTGIPAGAKISAKQLKHIMISQQAARKYEVKKRQRMGIDLPKASAEVEDSMQLTSLPLAGVSAAFEARAPKRGRPRKAASGNLAPGASPTSSNTFHILEVGVEHPLGYCPSFFAHFQPFQNQNDRFDSEYYPILAWKRLLKPICSNIDRADVSRGDNVEEGSAPLAKRQRIAPTSLAANDTAIPLTRPEQVQALQRPGPGMYVGDTVDLKRAGRGRRPKSRMAVIKTTKLATMAWLSEYSPPSPVCEEGTNPINSSAVPIQLPAINEAETQNFPSKSSHENDINHESQEQTSLEETSQVILVNGKTFRQSDPLAPASSVHHAVVADTSAAILSPSTTSTSQHHRTLSKKTDQRLAVESNESAPSKPPDLHNAKRSVKIKRQQVVLDILNAAGGLYPEKALYYPFATTWMSSNIGVKPDPKTVRSAVDALVASLKLKKVIFNFKNKIGITATRSIVALPYLDSHNDRIKTLQERIIEEDPRIYFPEGPEISQELRPHSKLPPSSKPFTREERKVELLHIPVYLQKRIAAAESGKKPRKRRRIGLNANVATEEGNDESGEIPDDHSSIDIRNDSDSDLNSDHRQDSPEPSAADSHDDQIEMEAAPLQTAAVSTHSSEASFISKEGNPLQQDLEQPLQPRMRVDQAAMAHHKPRRLASLLEKPQGRLARPEDWAADKRTRHRSLRLGDMHEGWNFRLYVATQLARMLVGGLNMTIDWAIVEAMLGREFSVRGIKARWVNIRSGYMPMHQSTRKEIREAVAVGFEEGVIPRIHFAHPLHNNWEEILEWTLKHVHEQPLRDHLFRSRTEMEKDHEVEIASQPLHGQFYEEHGTQSMAYKRALVHGFAHVHVHRNRSRSKPCSLFDVAKSWVRATVAAPKQAYSASFVEAKLALLGEAEIQDAVKALHASKRLMQENKGRPFHSRSYDFSEWYTSKLANVTEVAQLKDAARFKHTLDEKFRDSDEMKLTMTDSDGTFLAAFNMIGHGALAIRQGDDLPRAPNGLLDSGYQTRQMDKKRLPFGCSLVRQTRYIDGNPLHLDVGPPCCVPQLDQNGNNLARIPMWFDINGNLLDAMWDVARATVGVGLSVRSSLMPALMAETLNLYLEKYEVELVYQWLVDVGAAEWVETETGTVRLREWWWLILGDSVR